MVLKISLLKWNFSFVDEGGSDESSLLLSEKPSNERVKKRAPHHPLTHDSIPHKGQEHPAGTLHG